MKKTKQFKIFLIAAFVTVSSGAFAQVKIGDNPTVINSHSALDVESTNKGFIPPRVSLTAANVAAPIIGLGAGDAGVTVYNLATAGSGPTLVTPGLCSWDGSKWICVTALQQTVETAFSANKGNSQNIPASTLTKMTYVSESYDRGNDYSTANSSFVVQTSGIYQITACASFPSGNLSSVTGRSIRLHKNGVQINGGLVAANMTGTDAYGACGSTNVLLSAGDVLELYTHVGGTALTITNATFEGLKVSN